jgi:hypothetical protein
MINKILKSKSLLLCNFGYIVCKTILKINLDKF